MGTLKKFSKLCVNLDALLSMYGARIIIETGCYGGESLDYALKNLKITHAYSCDVNIKYVNYCKDFLKNYPNVDIVNQLSVDFLEELLPKLKNEESLFFWLDAHDKATAGWVSPLVELDCPLEKELEIIYKHRPNKRDIILVDDFGLYSDGPYELKIDKLSYLNPDFLEKYNFSKHYFYEDKGYLLLLGQNS